MHIEAYRSTQLRDRADTGEGSNFGKALTLAAQVDALRVAVHQGGCDECWSGTQLADCFGTSASAEGPRGKSSARIPYAVAATAGKAVHSGL